MAEGGWDCDLQTDAVPGDSYEELEQKFQTQTIQHHDLVADPRNGARSRKSAVDKSKTSEEIEALHLQHSKSETDDLYIEKCRHLLPPELQADFHDGIIEYCEDNDDDEIGAKQFLALIKTKVMLDGGEAPKVVLFNEMSPGGGTTPVERLDHYILHCTYKFLYVTESFCKDKMKTHSSATCLTESVYVPEQNYTVVPIFTTDKYNAPYKIPSSIRSLIGVNYYKDNTFPADKLRRLFQPKVAYRKEQEAVIKQKRIDAIRQMRVDALRQKTAEERRRQKLREEKMLLLGLKQNLNCMPALQPWNVDPQKHHELAVGTTSIQVSHALSQNVSGQPSSNKLFAVGQTREDDNMTLKTVRTDPQENTSTCREVTETRSDPDGDATERRSTHAANPPPTSTSANAADTFDTTKSLVISTEKADEGAAPNKHGTGQAYASVECLHASDLVADDAQHVSKTTLTQTPGSAAPFRTQGGEGVAAGKVILIEDTTAVKATVYDENVDSASAFSDKDIGYSDSSGIPDPRKDFCHQQLVDACAYQLPSVSEAKASATIYSRGAGRPPCARAAQGCNVPPPFADHRASQSACARPNSPPPPYCEQVPQHVPTVVVHNYYYGKVHNVYGGQEHEPVRKPSEPQPTTVNINIGSARAVMVGGRNQRFTGIDVDSSRADTTSDHAEEQSVADQEETIGGIQETQSLEPETAWNYGSDPDEYTPRSPVYSVRSANWNSDDEDTQSKMAHS